MPVYPSPSFNNELSAFFLFLFPYTHFCFVFLLDYFKASAGHHIISLINKEVFPFWHSPCLALKIVLDVALKRMILERVCNVFLL